MRAADSQGLRTTGRSPPNPQDEKRLADLLAAHPNTAEPEQQANATRAMSPTPNGADLWQRSAMLC